MSDTLHIVDDGMDGDTGLYVNGKLHTSIHCNDSHELPSTLYELMVQYNFVLVQNLMLTDEGAELYAGVHHDKYEHPESLETYAGLYEVTQAYKRRRSL